ncbi:MEDS domain-containing protein [Sphaerisporangium fuscum]|uniref:MEDS domain-containing protein n=1 Tax=Sphaerisporangium fuscum TaxID=2835868 RepID=UPI001BDDB4B3|nr:MEDS domain-containing protein [Sphaerisporangium fuscum]
MAHPTTVDALTLGDHVCWTFDDHERHLNALARFVQGGLAQHHQVLYLTDTFLPQAFLAALGAYGVDVDGPRRDGQLQVSTSDESYLAYGAVDPEHALRGWSKAIDDAHAQGYTGLRVAADMGWSVHQVSGVERLAWYEAQANRIFSQGRAMVLCCYDRRLFTTAELERLSRAHPGTAQAGAGVKEHWRPLLRMRRAPDALVLSGNADSSNREALAVMLDHLLEDTPAGVDTVTVDVSDLTLTDMDAARLLVCAVNTAPARVHLAGVGDPLADLLTLLDLRPVPLPLDGCSSGDQRRFIA